MASTKHLVFQTIRLGDIQCLEALAAGSGADFNCRHPDFGYTTLQAVVLAHLIPQVGVNRTPSMGQRSAEVAKQVAEWLILHGADPNSEADSGPRIKALSGAWSCSVGGHAISISFTTEAHSALSMLVKLKADAQAGKHADIWERQVAPFAGIGPLIHIMLHTSSKLTPSSSKQQVATSVLDRWDSIRADTASHDLTIQCSDASVSAHSHVISAASPVVRAMLLSGMREAAKKEICVDCSSTSASFLLDLMYTGSSCRDFAVDFGLPALDLAHRWQVADVVRMLERAAVEELSAENFAEMAEAAVLKDLEQLKAACRRLASEKKEVLDKTTLPDVVLTWLDDIVPTQRKSKKQRRMY